MRNLITTASFAATSVSAQFRWFSYFTPDGLLELTKMAFPNNSCHTVADRNKADVADFFSLVDSKEQYVDKDFTPDARSLYWRDMGE